jgi:hypothetical protein
MCFEIFSISPSLAQSKRALPFGKHVESFGVWQQAEYDLPNEQRGIVPTVAFYDKYFRKVGVIP